MYTEISIRGFRTFERIKLEGLGRVNVVVGENGAGKTSFLEAVRLLGARGNPAALYASAMERGEYDVEDDDDNGSSDRVAVLRFAFHGREVGAGAAFEIEAVDPAMQAFRIRAEVFDASPLDPEAPVFIDPKIEDPASSSGYEERGMFPEWAIRITGFGKNARPTELPVGWSQAHAARFRLAAPPALARIRSPKALPVFLRANSLDDVILGHLWDGVVATPAKEGVVASLRHIEPSVRDIDLRADRRLPFRSRVAVRLSNGKESSAPIGSLGEGITWLFALALGVEATPGAVLLVDDIDAGLHHRVMESMWHLVLDAACRRGIQVFASTHSIDCLTALRRVCEQRPSWSEEIRVVRLVKGAAKAITFTAEELQTAIDGEIEVRG